MKLPSLDPTIADGYHLTNDIRTARDYADRNELELSRLALDAAQRNLARISAAIEDAITMLGGKAGRITDQR